MPSSLENLFSTNDSERNFKHKIIDIDKLTEKYTVLKDLKDDFNTDDDEHKKNILTKLCNIYKIEQKYTIDPSGKITDAKITNDLDSGFDYTKLSSYIKLMKTTDKSTAEIICNAAVHLMTKFNIFVKVYFLLNNIEILFLCDTMDYKLMTRILNRDNFISDVHYKKACFIAMVVFEMWSLIMNDEGRSDIDDKTKSFYQQNLIYQTANPDYKPYKNAKNIHDLIHEIKHDAEDFVKSPDFDYALEHNTFEIEIPKRNLDNIIKPVPEIRQPDNSPVFKRFNFKSIEQPIYDGNILPNSIHGGVRRIQGGNEEKLNELKNAYESEFKSENNSLNQTRFLFDCLINANSEKAAQCMNTLSISTAKIDSYKIVETLPRATLVKLAYVLGIHFENNKIETYTDWIKRTKGDFKNYVYDEGEKEGEVKKDIKFEGDIKKETYKKLILIHYIGQVIIDKLADRNVEYDILRAQNKAKVQFNKVSGPEVSYRTKSNYTNFRSNSHSLSLSSNPIFMNMNLYSQQSPEQIDRIKSGIMAGGAPDAQLYSSNIYEKAITQALNKYKSMGFKIDPNDMKVIDDTIEGLKKVEYSILDTYSQLMNVLQFSTMRNNPSFMASLTEEEKKQVEQAWTDKNPAEILKLKNKLDKELKEKQTLADNAKTILDVIFPWKKSLEETMNKNTTELKEAIGKIPNEYVKKEDLNKLTLKTDLTDEIKTLQNLMKLYPSNADLKKTLANQFIAKHDGSTVDKPKVSEEIANIVADAIGLTEETTPKKTVFVSIVKA